MIITYDTSCYHTNAEIMYFDDNRFM